MDIITKVPGYVVLVILAYLIVRELVRTAAIEFNVTMLDRVRDHAAQLENGEG